MCRTRPINSKKNKFIAADAQTTNTTIEINLPAVNSSFTTNNNSQTRYSKQISSPITIVGIDTSKKGKIQIDDNHPVETIYTAILPMADCTLVCNDNSQILSNKRLIDNSTYFINSNDNRKKVEFVMSDSQSSDSIDIKFIRIIRFNYNQ